MQRHFPSHELSRDNGWLLYTEDRQSTLRELRFWLSIHLARYVHRDHSSLCIRWGCMHLCQHGSHFHSHSRMLLYGSMRRIHRAYTILIILENHCYEGAPKAFWHFVHSYIDICITSTATRWTRSSWIQIKQPEVLMLIGIMLRKPLVPRDIVWSKFATPTILAKALFLAVSYKDLAA